MIFKAKTVRDALEGTGWDKLEGSDDRFHEFLKKYGNYACKFPAKIRRNVTYYELYEKSCHGWEFCVFQNGKTLDLAFMDPFEDALCLAYTCNYNPKVEIFEYGQAPFKETIILKNLAVLSAHFDDFNIFNMDGSRIENHDDLFYRTSGLVAISKKSLSGPFRDDSEETSIHIVMRYFCPTAQSILANRNRW